MKRAAIFSPYLDSLGGGERYVLSVAMVLKNAGWSVDVETKDASVLKKAESRLGLNLEGIKAVDSIKRGDGYDLCFWLSDGSIPRLLARKNILHFQRPFYNVDGRSLLARMKFIRINEVVVNSQFTKNWIDKEYPQKAIVLYPPVDTSNFKKYKKEKLILYVGRFSQLEQNKRQDVLLSAFKKFHDKVDQGYKLVLAGGSDVGRTEFVDQLKADAKGYPIRILENASFKEIRKLFGTAKFFWSAAGYGIDVQKFPEKVEHFGITVVEAMSAGAVPLVFAAGGHREIVEDRQNGFLWDKKNHLLSLTEKLILNEKLYRKLQIQAIKDSKKYSYENFKKNFLKIIQ